MERLCVLLVAQSPVLRIGIRGLLHASFPIAAVVEADGALESVALVTTTKPDLVVIQDALPGVTGVVAARMVRELQPDAIIVVLSDHAGEMDIAAAMQHGADALLDSTVNTALFLDTIHRLTGGRAPEADLVLSSPVPADEDGLHASDIAVLDGIARGFSPRELADHLLVTEAAIRTRTSALVRKLRAVDRTTAVVAAVRTGIVDLSVQLPSAPLESGASA